MNRDSLELIKEFRSIKEKRLAKELAQIKSKMMKREDELSLLIKEKDRLLNLEREIKTGKIDLGTLELLFFQIDHIESKIQKIKEELSQIKKEYEEKFKQLVSAAKQRRLIERLIEVWEDRYRYELMKKEQKFFDDISNTRYAHENA